MECFDVNTQLDFTILVHPLYGAADSDTSGTVLSRTDPMVPEAVVYTALAGEESFGAEYVSTVVAFAGQPTEDCADADLGRPLMSDADPHKGADIYEAYAFSIDPESIKQMRDEVLSQSCGYGTPEKVGTILRRHADAYGYKVIGPKEDGPFTKFLVKPCIFFPGPKGHGSATVSVHRSGRISYTCHANRCKHPVTLELRNQWLDLLRKFGEIKG
jgi:hypothetical protein